MIAGCSGTRLAAKLGVENGTTVRLVAAPEGFEDVLAAPYGAHVRRRGPYRADVVCAVTDVWSGLRLVWRKERR